MTPEQIKDRMEKRKFTQYSLADHLGVSQTTINFLIHGKRMSDKLEKRFARAIGVKHEELYDEGKAA